MSLFRSKLWDFSAADQILNLGWFKAYLSSLWAFVPHPQTFSSDRCFLLRIILAAFSNYGSQLWLSNQFQVRFSRWELSRSGFCVKSRAKSNFCHIVSHLLFNFKFFYFSDGWKDQLRGAGHIRSGRLVWIGWDQQMGFSSTQALTPAQTRFLNVACSWQKPLSLFLRFSKLVYMSAVKGVSSKGKTSLRKGEFQTERGSTQFCIPGLFPMFSSTSQTSW